LAGMVRVVRLGTFVPNAGDTFAILSAASRSGKWSKEIGGVIKSKKYFLPRYSSTGASLAVKVASFAISPSSGPAGTAVTLTGSGYPPNDQVTLSFKDAAGTVTTFASVTTSPTGGFSTIQNIPGGAAAGTGTFTAKSTLTGVKASGTFTVT
jgi:hypothetical protein